MPQTYIVAVGPGAVGRTRPVDVSCNRSGGPCPARWGRSTADHESIPDNLRGAPACATVVFGGHYRRTVRSRTAAALAAGALLAAAVVAVVAARPDCTLDDAPPAVLPAEAGDAPDLGGIGLGPASYRLRAGGTPFHLVATPVADVLTTVSPAGGALLTAVHPDTGEVRWSVQVPGGGVDVAVTGGRVVGATRTERARFFALDLADGGNRVCVALHELPEIPYVARRDWLPVGAHGDVAVVSAPVAGGGRLTGLDVRSGRVRWTLDGATPRLLETRTGVLTADGREIDTATGEVRPGPGEREVVGGLDGGYVAADDERVGAVAGGVLAWSTPRTGVDGNRTDEVVGAGATVLVNDHDPAGLRGLDAATGAVRWRLDDTDLTGLGQQAMLPFGTHVLVVGRRSVLARVDPATGEVRRADPGRLVAAATAAPDGRLVLQAGGVLTSHPPAV